MVIQWRVSGRQISTLEPKCFNSYEAGQEVTSNLTRMTFHWLMPVSLRCPSSSMRCINCIPLSLRDNYLRTQTYVARSASAKLLISDHNISIDHAIGRHDVFPCGIGGYPFSGRLYSIRKSPVSSHTPKAQSCAILIGFIP